MPDNTQAGQTTQTAPTGYHVVAPATLQDFTARVFEGLGTPADIAAAVAEHLVRANLSGHDSHGVIRIPQYASWIEQGWIKPAARPSVLHEHGATILVDGAYSYGQFASNFALARAMERARDLGAAVAAIRHANHIGRVGEYTERAAREGCVAIVTVGAAGPGIGGAAPYGGANRFLGTNPWSVGIPRVGADGQPDDPVLADFATTVLAEGKVRVARDSHKTLPEGVILDKEGNPSTNPSDLYAGGVLLPFGAHKGYCLALASALLGSLSAIGQEEPSMAGAAAPPEWTSEGDRTGGVFMVVVDVRAFGDPAEYAATAGRVTAAARKVRRQPGFGEVLIPGDPEYRNRAQRVRSGIAVPDDTWQMIDAVASKVGVPMPQS